MAEIRVPTLGESVTEATIGKWFKQAGDAVMLDEPLVELETDKVTVEVPAPAAGVLTEIAAKGGETVPVGALLGQIKEQAATPGAAAAAPSPRTEQKTDGAARARVAEKAPEREPHPRSAEKPEARSPASGALPVPPSVRKIAAESGLDPSTLQGSGKDGRITKADMLAAIERAAAAPTPIPQPSAA